MTYFCHLSFLINTQKSIRKWAQKMNDIQPNDTEYGREDWKKTESCFILCIGHRDCAKQCKRNRPNASGKWCSHKNCHHCFIYYFSFYFLIWRWLPSVLLVALPLFPIFLCIFFCPFVDALYSVKFVHFGYHIKYSLSRNQMPSLYVSIYLMYPCCVICAKFFDTILQISISSNKEKRRNTNMSVTFVLSIHFNSSSWNLHSDFAIKTFMHCSNIPVTMNCEQKWRKNIGKQCCGRLVFVHNCDVFMRNVTLKIKQSKTGPTIW